MVEYMGKVKVDEIVVPPIQLFCVHATLHILYDDPILNSATHDNVFCIPYRFRLSEQLLWKITREFDRDEVTLNYFTKWIISQ